MMKMLLNKVNLLKNPFRLRNHTVISQFNVFNRGFEYFLVLPSVMKMLLNGVNLLKKNSDYLTIQ